MIFIILTASPIFVCFNIPSRRYISVLSDSLLLGTNILLADQVFAVDCIYFGAKRIHDSNIGVCAEHRVVAMLAID